MSMTEKVEQLYVKSDTLSTRISIHDKYSVNKYGFGNWVFDQYGLCEGAKVLELGCGTAVMWQNRKIPPGATIVLSDFSPLMLQKATELLQNNPAFSFRQIDIQEIPYGDAAFDVVIANHMLYHVPDKNKALTEVRRVLKPGGIFYATTLGEMSLLELDDVCRKLEGKATFSYAKDISFTLENGGDLLARYFTNVEQRQYIDALEVTNIDDIVAYKTSYNTMSDAVKDEFRRLIGEQFVDGVFRIRKEQGIFVCK